MLPILAAAILAGCSLFFNYPEHLESDADTDMDEEHADPDTPDLSDPEVDRPEAEPDPDMPGDDATDEETSEDVGPEDALEEEAEPFCGDGEQNGTEECDDGNDTNGDGCDNDCTFSCYVANQDTDCDDGESCTDNICNGGTHVCSNPPVTEGTPCSDGDDCTYPDTCSAAGRCEGVLIDPCQDTWIVRFDLNQSEARGTSIIQAADGGYLVVGASSDMGPGGLDMWMAKLTPVGTVLWQKAMGGAGTDHAGGVIETSDGNLVIAGASSSWTYPWPDDIDALSGYLVKLRPDGSVLWQRVLGGMGLDEIKAVTETSTGNIAFTGYFNGGSSGQQVWAGLMDTDGNLQWHGTYGTIYTGDGQSIIETSDGNLLVVATGVDNPDYFYEGWFLKINAASGALLWSKSLASGMINVRAYDAAENPATSGILFAGAEGNSAAGFTFGEISASGSGITWINKISPDNQNRAISVILESSGGLLLSGWTGGNRHWAAKLNGRSASAALVWNKQVGASMNSYQTRPNALIESATGHVVMSTWTQPSGGQWDLMVINMNAGASVVGTCGQINDFGYGLSGGGPSLGNITSITSGTRTNVTKSPSGSQVDTTIPMTFVCPE
jgi:cysteine-rich repeat protein